MLITLFFSGKVDLCIELPVVKLRNIFENNENHKKCAAPPCRFYLLAVSGDPYTECQESFCGLTFNLNLNSLIEWNISPGIALLKNIHLTTFTFSPQPL